MEKYLIIIILVVLAYYLHRYCIQIEIKKILKTKEGFADTINTSDPDLVKSITTLGQIAKDLQAGGLKIPGNLTVTGTIKTGTDLSDIADRLTKLEKLPSGMRLFQIDCDVSGDMLITDPSKSAYSSSDWVCCVQGVRSHWGDVHTPKGLQLFCFERENKWYLRSYVDNGDGYSKPIILAIPKKYFEIVHPIQSYPNNRHQWG